MPTDYFRLARHPPAIGGKRQWPHADSMLSQFLGGEVDLKDAESLDRGLAFLRHFASPGMLAIMGAGLSPAYQTG